MAIISYKDLTSLKSLHTGKKIVFCSGSFDLTHVGHVLFFEDCKKIGDILIVAVGRDEHIRELKGLNRPILNEKVRLKMIDSLKPVDYASLEPSSPQNGLSSSQTAALEVMFNYLTPDIWAVNNDAGQIEIRKELAKKLGIQLVVLERNAPLEFESISTTSIIKKIRGLES